MKARAGVICRSAAGIVAVLLAVQSIWLVLVQSIQPGVDRLPTDPTLASRAAQDRTSAEHAASIGTLRGDLWAQAAFSYADLLWNPKAADAGHTAELARARAIVTRSLHQAPHDSEVWLLAAGLGLNYPSPQKPNPIQALKMSYYTGPSDQWIRALRFRLTASSDFVGDVEMRQFVERDLRLLIEEKHKAEILQAYLAASPDGRQFMEQTVKDIDPSAAAWLPTPGPPDLPN